MTGIPMAATSDSLIVSSIVSLIAYRAMSGCGFAKRLNRKALCVVGNLQIDKGLQGSANASRDELAAPQTWILHQLFIFFLIFLSGPLHWIFGSLNCFTWTLISGVETDCAS